MREICEQEVNPRTAAAQARAQHLYVMQAASGAIKVGRSNDAERRRRALENGGGQHIKLVLELKNQGAREHQIHEALGGYRLKGEWFRGSSATQAVLERELGCRLSFPFGPDGHLRRGKLAAAATKAQNEAERAMFELAADIRAERPLKATYR